MQDDGDCPMFTICYCCKVSITLEPTFLFVVGMEKIFVQVSRLDEVLLRRSIGEKIRAE